jgi:hypothetical protein
MTRLTLLLLSAWIPYQLKAQKDTTRHNELNVTLNYQSRVSYFGRTDSLKSSLFFPTIDLESKWGFYAEGNFVFLNNALETMEYAGTLVQVGYRFPESKHFSGNLFYNQVLYRDNVDLVQSAVREQPGVNLTFKSDIVNLTLGGDLKFSQQTDVGATGGLDHLWIIKLKAPKTAIGIDPSAYVYMGTQRFSQTYLEQKDLLGIPLGSQQITQQSQRFSVLSYEFSVPVVFVKGKWNATVTPAYVLPMNLLPGETGGDMFYASAAVGVRF